MAAARKKSGFRLPAISFGSLVGAALLVVMVTGFVFAWKTWRPEVAARSNRPLTVEQVQMTPSPPWIRARIKEEAFRDGSLGERMLLEKDLTYIVYRAFEMHPWIQKVDRVSKHPDGIVYVDVHYRRPVAWVEIPSGMSSLDEAGVLPIDEEAVILPPEDLEGRIGDFIRISIPDLPPWGLKGTPWGDRRLIGAARLAGLLEGVWQGLALQRIRVVPNYDAAHRSGPLFELVTTSGTRVLWGSAPGDEVTGEAAAPQKLMRLKHVIGQGLSASDGIVDLRLAGRPAANR